MKRKLLILITFLIPTLILLGQNKNIVPPKKTNTIIISRKDVAEHFLLDYAKHLQNYGFSIEKFDKEFLTLATDFKRYKFGGVAVIKIVAYSKQTGDTSKIIIKGKIEISNPYGGQVPDEACNCGMAGDARKNGFKEILKTLDNFNYDRIEFLKK